VICQDLMHKRICAYKSESVTEYGWKFFFKFTFKTVHAKTYTLIV